MNQPLTIKCRVINRYREGQRTVMEGEKVVLPIADARRLEAGGFVRPITGPMEIKEKKVASGTVGSAAPQSSSPADPASRPRIATPSRRGRRATAGVASR